MAAEDESTSAVVELNEEVEGDAIGSRNYRFSKIGESVPITSDGAFNFDPQSCPSQPMAISERFRLLFVAHNQGFYVARTKDVMAAAEEIKEKKTATSIRDLCLVDIPIGEVSILTMSADDSLLAASVGSCLHFFAVSALLHKEQKPSYSVPLDDFIIIKDVHWAREVSKDYLILSSCGKLYHGSGQSPVTHVMEDVDSVDWSTRGDYIAVVKRNVVSILSVNFKEKIRFTLLFQSVIGDSDVNQFIRVDSIRWIRPDNIVVGCFQLNDDGEEENYIVQVISSRGGIITDINEASKPTILSFNAVFWEWFTDVVPTRNGPHLLISYLDLYGLAFVANRNLSPQVALFCWQGNGKNEAAIVEILNDAWGLHIDTQGDENVIIGLSVDKVSQNESKKLTLGDDEREVPPCCVIMCLTIDGQLSLFHFTSGAGPLVSPEGCASAEEKYASQVSVKHNEPLISSAGANKSSEPTFSMSQSHGLSKIEVEKTSAKATATNDLSPFKIGFSSKIEVEKTSAKATAAATATATNDSSPFKVDIKPRETATENMGHKPLFNPERLKVDESEKTHSVVLNRDNNSGNQSVSEAKHNIAVSPGKVESNFFHQSASNVQLLGSDVTTLPKVVPSENSSSTWSLIRPNEKVDAPKTSDGRFSTLHSDEVGIFGKQVQTAGGVQHLTDLKEKPSVNFASPGQTMLTAQRERNSQPAYAGFQVPLGNTSAPVKSVKSDFKKQLSAASSITSVSQVAQNASKQFENAEEMAEKLDILLEAIEGQGGFLDESITSQTRSVLELEEGIWALSDRCRIQRGSMNEQQRELQLLLDKTVEVLVRKVYMEGIFKQATDSKYWELWNHQKLSSELELKRRHILKLDQELTSKLIELERHFNSLEFNRFHEKEGMQRDRRALQNSRGQSRQIQSLRSLHSTMIAQLAAAEKLSGCLSNQMSALSIESSGKHDVKRELFDSIGLPYTGDTEISPAMNNLSNTPANNKSLMTPGSIAIKGQSRKNQMNLAKGHESEITATRRRESFDRSWASFDPPKTVLKRVLKEDNEKGSSNRSLLNIGKQYLSPQSHKKQEVARSALSGASSQSQYKSKGFTEATVEQFSLSPPISLHNRITGFQDHGVQTSSTAPNYVAAQPPPSILEKRTAQTDEISKESLHLSGNNYYFSGNETKLAQKSDTSSHPLPSLSTQLPNQSLTSKFDSGESVNRFKTGSTKSTSWDQKNTTVLPGTPLFDTKIPFTPATTFSSGLNVSEKGLFSKNSEESSFGSDGLSASSPLQSVVGSSLTSKDNNPLPASLVSKPYSSSAFTSTFKSSDVKQQTSQPQPSVTTSLDFPSALPSLTGESYSSLVSFSSSVVRSEPSSSLPSASVFVSKAEDISDKVYKMPLKSEMGDKIDISSTQSELSISTSNLKPKPPTLGSINESPTNLKPESQGGLVVSSANSSIVPSVDKVEMPSANEALPTVAVSSEGINGNMKNAVSVSSHEEEMEEEAPEDNQTPIFALSNLGGFGIGQTQNSSTPKPNPFGVLNTNASFANSPFTMSASSGELFRPSSFSFQSPQPGPTTTNFSGGFSSSSPNQASGAAGFGQPAQIGPGQQALGSMLGSFGQSRQIGTVLPGGNSAAPTSGFGGGFGGGFAAAPSSGGFASLGAGGGGFGAVAGAGGGFAAAAGGGGGFAAAAGGGGGFAAAAGGGGGFAAAAGAISGGGFGAFSNQSGTFGGGSGTAPPPSELFTQMRK